MPELQKSLGYRMLSDGSIEATLTLTFANGARRVYRERFTPSDAAAAADDMENPFRVAGAKKPVLDEGHWYWSVMLGKSLSDERAIQAWWKSLGRGKRATARAIAKEHPKGASVKQIHAWWSALGKKRRGLARGRHGGEGGDGLLGDVARAASSAASTAIDAVTLQPLTKHIPVVGDALRAVNNLQKLPLRAASDVLSGKRIDRVAVSRLKSAVASAKTLAPYVQSVVSMVPGIGSGIAGGIGAALALAEGKSITDALIVAARSAVPGGALAQAAFDVAAGLAQGKSLDQAALGALPIDATAKRLLVEGLKAARSVASGKPVDQALMDGALSALPAVAGKAAQIGVALGAARTLQETGLAAAKKLAAGKVLQAASKSLQATSETPLGKDAARLLGATGRLANADAAYSLGASGAAKRLVRGAEKKLKGAPAVFAAARASQESIKRLAEGAPKPVATSVLAAARKGRVQSNRPGAVSERELAAAFQAGRVFFVRAA